MLPRQITHQNIFRVLMAGFTLVIVLLVAAAIVGIRNIQSIQANANNLVREQSVTNRLIDELHSQQTTLSEVFSVLARDPDSVDYYKIMSQLDEADRDIARISERRGAHRRARSLAAAQPFVARFLAGSAPPAVHRGARDLFLHRSLPLPRQPSPASWRACWKPSTAN